MLCNKCGKNEATHFMEKNVNGKVTKLALCSECAKNSEEFKFDPFEGFKNFNIFDNFFGFPSIGSGRGKMLETAEKRCTLCASTFDDIVNAGKVGCAECYNVFADELAPTIKRIHGNRRHIGRRPLKDLTKSGEEKTAKEDKEENPKDRIKKMKKELNDAVKSENYELAAELRDKIREVESL